MIKPIYIYIDKTETTLNQRKHLHRSQIKAPNNKTIPLCKQRQTETDRDRHTQTDSINVGPTTPASIENMAQNKKC